MKMKALMALAAVGAMACALAEPTQAKRPSKDARIMVLGDSITHSGYAPYYLEMIESLRHPGLGVRYFNAGYSGATAGTGVERLKVELAQHRPTAVYVMFGMNDVRWTDYTEDTVFTPERQRAADEALGNYKWAMGVLLKEIADAGVTDVTLVTPTPYDEYSDGPRRRFVSEYGLRKAAEIVRELSAERGIPVVDLNAAFTDACRKHPEKKLCGDDRVHPGRLGHLLAAATYLRAYGETAPVASVTLDARGTVIRADGAHIDSVQAADGTLEFDYAPQALPLPDLPEVRELSAMDPSLLSFNREPLAVIGLADGTWELLADGRSLGQFTARQLSLGVDLAACDTPNRRLAGEAAEAMTRLHDFDMPLRNAACSRRAFEAFGIDMNDKAALQAASDKRLARLQAENCPWFAFERDAANAFLATVGNEAKIEADRGALSAAVARPRAVRTRLKLVRRGACAQ